MSLCKTNNRLINVPIITSLFNISFKTQKNSCNDH